MPIGTAVLREGGTAEVVSNEKAKQDISDHQFKNSEHEEEPDQEGDYSDSEDEEGAFENSLDKNIYDTAFKEHRLTAVAKKQQTEGFEENKHSTSISEHTLDF